MSVGLCGRKSCAWQAFRGHLLRALRLETLGATSVLVRSGTYAPGTHPPSARLRRVLGTAAPVWLRFLPDGRAGRCAAAGLFFAPHNLANITGRGTAGAPAYSTFSPFPIATTPPADTVNLDLSMSRSTPISAPSGTTTFLSMIALRTTALRPISTPCMSTDPST